jgi:hypothetical protein
MAQPRFTRFAVAFGTPLAIVAVFGVLLSWLYGA